MARLADLPQTAKLLLDLFVGGLGDAGIDVPRRRYVSNGPLLVEDGEQVVVSVPRLTRGMPGVAPATSMDPHTLMFAAAWTLWVVVKVPVVGTRPRGAAVPSAASLDASGAQTMALMQAIILTARNINIGYVFTDPGEGFAVGQVAPLEPAGGLAGVTATIETTVN